MKPFQLLSMIIITIYCKKQLEFDFVNNLNKYTTNYHQLFFLITMPRWFNEKLAFYKSNLGQILFYCCNIELRKHF